MNFNINKCYAKYEKISKNRLKNMDNEMKSSLHNPKENY